MGMYTPLCCTLEGGGIGAIDLKLSRLEACIQRATRRFFVSVQAFLVSVYIFVALSFSRLKHRYVQFQIGV
jgi:hypothetical protein